MCLRCAWQWEPNVQRTPYSKIIISPQWKTKKKANKEYFWSQKKFKKKEVTTGTRDENADLRRRETKRGWCLLFFPSKRRMCSCATFSLPFTEWWPLSIVGSTLPQREKCNGKERIGKWFHCSLTKHKNSVY